MRDETKYDRMIAFGKALEGIRRQTAHDMALTGLPREKVLGTIVRLLETTLIRIGNEEYARQNGSFGLTTMHNRHVAVNGSDLRFEFKGKSGIKHVIDLHNKRLARVVRSCRELPGHELFQYVDEEGTRHAIDSADVNAYLQQITGSKFTAKDFRTWAGTVLAAQALQEFEEFDSDTLAKRNIMTAIEAVAKRLGNTKAICRKCYVHPAVLDAYLDGTLRQTLGNKVEQELKHSLAHLHPEEAVVLAFLQERLKRDS